MEESIKMRGGNNITRENIMSDYRIKLCGMMRDCDIDFANEAKPDFVGFVFADTRRKVTRQQATRFRSNLSDEIRAAGVFVDEDVTRVGELLKDGIIDVAQLHGHEDADYIRRLKDICDKPVIKAVKVASVVDIVNAGKLDVDYLLLDTYKKGVLGGTGEAFNWEIIHEAKKQDIISMESGLLFGKRFFLAGGINIDNIKRAAEEVKPFGVDLSTGIETDGYKDKYKMIEAVRRIRNV